MKILRQIGHVVAFFTFVNGLLSAAGGQFAYGALLVAVPVAYYVGTAWRGYRRAAPEPE